MSNLDCTYVETESPTKVSHGKLQMAKSRSIHGANQ